MEHQQEHVMTAAAQSTHQAAAAPARETKEPVQSAAKPHEPSSEEFKKPTSSSLLTPDWSKKLSNAIEKNKDQVFFALSTNGLDGSPRVRVASFPKYKHCEDEICLATSKKSGKWEELEKDQRFDLCIYLACTKERFRMRGDKVKFDGCEKELWENLTPELQQEFQRKKEKHGKDVFGVLRFVPNLHLTHEAESFKEKKVAHG